MQRNYHSSVEEALRPLQSIAAFNLKVLEEMKVETKSPIRGGHLGLDEGIINIYQDYQAGNKYIATSDVGHGIGKDFSVTVVMNARTGVVVADILHRTISPSEFAQQSVRLLKVYDAPLWYPENNDWGRAVIDTAVSLGYSKWGYENEKKTQVGFHTDERSRQDLWAALIPAVNSRQITIYNVEGLKQFGDIVRNPDKNGRIEAKEGRHDDYPMAVGIAWLKREETLTEWKPRVISSLHFASPDRSGGRR